MRREIICLNRFAGRLVIRAGLFEIDFDDLRVAVPPLAFEKINAFARRESITASGLPVGTSAFVSANARPAKKTSAVKVNSATKRKRHIEAQMGASRWARLNSVAQA